MTTPVRHLRFLSLVFWIAFAAKDEEWYFEYHGDGINYEWAFDVCESRGMSLLTQESSVRWQEYERFIDEQKILSMVWMGLTLPSDSTNPAHYRWGNGNPITWTRWKPGPRNPEPNDLSTDKCAIVKPNGLWYTRPCDGEQGVVCQGRKPVDKDPEPTFYFAGHFVRHCDLGGTPTLLWETRATSSMRCASHCQRLHLCFFMEWIKPETCKLFSELTTVVTTGDTARVSTLYRRQAELA